MNLVRLSLSYIRKRKLTTSLNVGLLAVGVATIVMLLLVGGQVEDNLTKNAEGIDLVVGASGSPIQIILSSVYHLDAPTGNIPVEEARTVEQHRAVDTAIPLALGDSYQGYRIVGTSPAYLEHYDVEPQVGDRWEDTYEVVAGAQVAAEEGLSVGDEIYSSHGLAPGGHTHDDVPLTVVGILESTGLVVDRLVLTSVETVWAVHDDHDHDHNGDDHDHDHNGDGHDHGDHEHNIRGDHGHGHNDHGHSDHEHDESEHDERGNVEPGVPGASASGAMPQEAPPEGEDEAAAPLTSEPDVGDDMLALDREYTALLIQYSSPMAAAVFPRWVNAETSLQAASPAHETTRMLSFLGIGLDALRAFGFLLILAAGIGLFIALYNAMEDRRFDMAMMRTLGASRGLLIRHVLLEGVVMALAGTLAGLALGHAATELLGLWVEATQEIPITGWTWRPEVLWLVAFAVGVGFVAALLPAWRAYRTDISRTLATS